MKETGIRFRPWVGPDYEKGVNGKKIMVLGHCHYCNDGSDGEEFTIKIIEGYIRWIQQGHPFCPAQIYYYFHDAEGRRWCIYLRWRHTDPWTAELVPCDESWKFITEEDLVDLLEEAEHVPGTVTGYYREDEYEPLMDEALRKVRTMFKEQEI